ncbi:hypothetical protein ACORG1_13020 [Mycobacterium sp. TJFP1]
MAAYTRNLRIAQGTHAATSKTVPASADEIPLVDSEGGNSLKRLTWANLLLAAGVGDSLTTGEATMSRNYVSSTACSTGNEMLRLTYFTARKTETINSVRVPTGGTAAAATPTLCRIGIYSVDGSGNLTLVASTANDTALFAASNTAYTKTLSSPFSKVAGTRYAVGVLVVTGGTAPTLTGQSALHTGEGDQAPKLFSTVLSQTDLPASVSAGSIGATGHRHYVVLAP